MTTITTAFKDAVHDSQHCFRQLLKAMSEPGQTVSLDRCPGFGSMHSATTQTLLTMADNVTPIWLSPSFATDQPIIDNLRFYCGSSIASSPEHATFAVISAMDTTSFDWSAAQFNLGSEEYPDQSTTVLVEFEGQLKGQTDEHKGQTVLLSGPGIESTQRLNITGAPEAFVKFLIQRQERFTFPLGVDLLLISHSQVVAIPRTTKVEVTTCM